MTQQVPLLDLASTYREFYRTRFRAEVQAGTTTPLIVPLHLFAYWVVPTLYLAIPHKNRPWLYRARWLVLAFVCAFHYDMIRHVKSLNFAASYGVGVIAAWGTIWNFYLLVWTKPQWDARRVERRRVPRPINGVGDDRVPERLSTSLEDIYRASNKPNGQAVVVSGVDGAVPAPRSDVTVVGNATRGVQSNGIGLANRLRKRESHAIQNTEQAVGERFFLEDIVALGKKENNPPLDKNSALELYELARKQEYEYYWQEYPADASFRTRFDWAFDIVSTFRLTGKYTYTDTLTSCPMLPIMRYGAKIHQGWKSAPSCLPPYKPPPTVGPYQLPLEYGPQLVPASRLSPPVQTAFISHYFYVLSKRERKKKPLLALLTTTNSSTQTARLSKDTNEPSHDES